MSNFDINPGDLVVGKSGAMARVGCVPSGRFPETLDGCVRCEISGTIAVIVSVAHNGWFRNGNSIPVYSVNFILTDGSIVHDNFLTLEDATKIRGLHWSFDKMWDKLS